MQQHFPASQECAHRQIRTILIVEDDEAVGDFLVAAIAQETPYHTCLVTNGPQALHVCATNKIDLMILDYSLPQMNGIELYDRLYDLQGSDIAPAVMVSARLPVSELAKRHLLSLRKPLELQNFLDTIERILH